jgi:hypothetical protein
MHFTANLGPIALTVDNGSLAIDGDGNITTTNDSMSLCIGPGNATKKYLSKKKKKKDY